MTWKKIVLAIDDSITGYRTKRLEDEHVDGTIDQLKVMIALQDFTGIREMYIQNMDPGTTKDPVDVYRVVKYNGVVEFIPWSFDIVQLAKVFPNPRDQAAIQLAASCQSNAEDKAYVRNLVDTIKSA